MSQASRAYYLATSAALSSMLVVDEKIVTKTCNFDPQGLEQDVFSKYLCSSSSDEEDCVKEPVVSVHVAGKIQEWCQLNRHSYTKLPTNHIGLLLFCFTNQCSLIS